MKKQFAGLFAMSLVSAPVLPFAASPASAKTVLPSQGSPGDRQDADECPPGSYLVGFSGRIGSAVEQIRIVCAPLERLAGVGRSEGPVRGGNAGDAVTVSCQVRSAVSGLYVLFTSGRQQVKRFNAFCRTVDGQDQSPLVFAGPDNDNLDSTTDRQDCPNSEIATGVAINSGSHINGLGLICDRITTAAAPSSGSSVAPVLAFQGGWQTVTDQNGHYTLVLQITNPSQYPLADLYVTGQFINTDGATQYNGIIQGVIPRGSRTLVYDYAQPQVKAGGKGQFTLSDNGNRLTGTGTAGGQTFTWNGTRAR